VGEVWGSIPHESNFFVAFSKCGASDIAMDHVIPVSALSKLHSPRNYLNIRLSRSTLACLHIYSINWPSDPPLPIDSQLSLHGGQLRLSMLFPQRQKREKI